MKSIAQALSLGFTIIANIGLGTLVGYGLDVWLGTKPIFMIIGILCGTVSAFLTLYAMVVKK
ncbi:AtpZ/AtpI family protein [Anaerorhabdus furcosa]|uniref:Putative F0F1-ATPase subunit Ca2+/Mg2+ transporter n=1 Tax=Anaerorhabdus furcosa TaxID=118967 RepID=A0A1T4KBK6_9FIRM|nr:AtpZ/AtpI family protein [Anaerorhabdus furcosa]SJZ39705.1 Putative F0F1-ATPase subunit Ca2+/Mg2+ transporter [Anaerorhabdus furcosa]